MMTTAPIGTPSERVRTFLDRLERSSVDELSVLALPELDPSESDVLRGRAELAAEDSGRLDQLDDVVDVAHELIVRSFSFRGLEPTWFGLNWGRAQSRSDDRALLFAAIEDAAIAAVIEDLLPDDAAALAEPYERAASMRGSAPASNPSSDTHRNAVRAAWVLGAFGWFVGGANLIVDLVAEIVASQVEPSF